VGVLLPSSPPVIVSTLVQLYDIRVHLFLSLSNLTAAGVFVSVFWILLVYAHVVVVRFD